MKNLKYRHKILSILITCFLAFLSSCDTNFRLNNSRGLASVSKSELRQVEYLLAVDRLHYYIGELTEFKKGKVSEEVIQGLRNLTPEVILSTGLNFNQIKDPQKFDNLIYRLLKDQNPNLALKKADVAWGYNFLKNKLAQSFTIEGYEKNDEIGSPKIGIAEKSQMELEPKILKVDNQTLEAEHYISNRTTRGIFWEALDNNRPMEFHLSDPREFKQNVGFRNGEILGEVKTISSNYNKVFLVKYPEEDTFRFAITNIGGVDRLEHLVSSLSLSRAGVSAIPNKIEVFGDIEGFHRAIQTRLENMLTHLPKADRLIIGQKATIETFFYTYWKLLALKNLYESFPKVLTNKESNKNLEKLIPLLEDPSGFDIGDHKGLIDKAYQKVKSPLEGKYADLLPERFKQFDFDNFVTSISDLEFKNKSGKTVRWRLAANVWGDEIVPIAQAFKNTGHTKVTYAGTAGALPDRGFSVGDFVIPSHIKLEEGYGKISQIEFGVEGAKTKARLGHVGSPFDETKDWLKKSIDDGLDLVEIEGKYLARVFGLDNVSLYLMVSDVLNSEGETLAQGSSSKRKAMLQRWMHTLADRDSKGLIADPRGPKNNLEKIREVVEQALGNKGDVYKHTIVSHFLDKKKVPTEKQVLDFADTRPVFSDNYFHTRLSEPSSFLTQFYRNFEGDLPSLGLSREFFTGSLNPKDEKLKIYFLADGDNQEAEIQKQLSALADDISEIDDLVEIKVVTSFDAEDSIAQLNPPRTFDSDFLFKLFSHYSLQKTGLDYQVTNAANVTFKFLPTSVTQDACELSAKSFCSLAHFSPSGIADNIRKALKGIFKGKGYKTFFNEKLAELNSDLKYKGNNEAFKAVIEKQQVKSLPDGKLAQIVPDFDPKKGLIVKLQITKEGWEKPEVVLEELGHLQQIVGEDSDIFKHPLYWASVTIDAQKGSNRAKEILATAEADVLTSIRSLATEMDVYGDELDTYIDARQGQVDDLQKEIRKLVRVENKSRKKIAKQWKAVQTKLQNQKLKLDDYIAKNDRAKVRQLIETFLPWEEMEPTEVNAWRNWLWAIGKPNSDFKKSEKIVFFRGLEGDLIRDADDGGHFLFSSMLQKNQGNYTRRLRSLKTYRDKLAKKTYSEIPYEGTSIVNSLKGHSHEPLGSPFVSVSNATTAHNFGGYPSVVAAMHLPRARTIDNLVSDYAETERLIPLIIFPDEILFISEGDEVAQLRKKASQAVGRPLTQMEKVGNGKVNPLEATKQFWEYITGAKADSPKGGSCSALIQKIFTGM